MKRILRRLLIWVPIGLIGLIILAVLVLGMIPVSADAATSPGPGPKPVDETDNGLSEAWPAMVTRPDNPSSPERAELGRLLFFDPVLSGDNAVSCATCHHPDLGFSDGRSQAMGVDGTGFGPARTGGRLARRHSPTVWNAAFNFRQFWDGRAADLEEQAGVTIQSPDEMNEQPEHLVAELKALPEYPAMFDRAFGGQNGSALTFQNVTYALAAFEQTLLSQNSPFDRYAHGDRTALTAAQRRGLNVFRSAATRCLECHNLTTFADPDFKVTGVADLPGQPPDLGRSEVAGGPGYDHAFKVPTLRNVALHAPYMHNGSLATLEEVIDFYARGGNDAHVSNLDDKIRKFDLSNQEKRDLIAFLNALTDESALPEIPSRVPSGLPVVAHVNNPARTAAQNMNTGASAILMVSGPAHTITARPSDNLQDVFDSARAGDTIVLQPGVYHQSAAIDTPRVTIQGQSADGQRPVFDGEGKLADGIISSGDDVTIQGIDFRNYTGNGVLVHGAKNITFRDLGVDNTGTYGIYPVECAGVLVENTTVVNVRDAGIYVGQSRDIIVRNNVVHDNVTGIEIENSVNAVVENNEAYNNVGGILVFLLPNAPSKIGSDTIVRNNRVHDNNHPTFAASGSTVANVPPGTGIMVMAADRTEVTGNEIRDNQSYGLALISLSQLYPKGTKFDVGPTPEGNWIHNNAYTHNGYSPDKKVSEAGLPGADVLWDASGWNNAFNEPGAKVFPPVLPNRSWPDLFRRAFWRVLSWAASQL